MTTHFLRRWGIDLWRPLLFAAFLTVALAGVMTIGVNLSNAMPSERAPYGWPGTSSFDNGVAIVRPQLILAASFPALMMGLSRARHLRATSDGPGRTGALLAYDMLLVSGAIFFAAVMARAAASKTSNDAFWAFFTAHFLLAACFYSLAMLSGVSFRSMPTLFAAGAWLGFVALYEGFVRWKTLRQAGLPGLNAGILPSWFFVAQALSPIAIYRGLLIFWHPKFRDYEEKAVLDGVTMPPWMTVEFFGWVFAFVWVIVPLELAWVIWSLRFAHTNRTKTRPVRHEHVPSAGFIEPRREPRSAPTARASDALDA